MTRIVIGGDVCPIGKIKLAFSSGDAHGIFHDLLDEIASADLSIVNLECPLVSKETPIAKIGEVLGADINCIKGFVAANWGVLNLANNHIFDHGVKGVNSTIDTINKAGLSFVGAGADIEDAQTPFIKNINGIRIVVYAMAEREFSVADENTAGANPLDLINFVRAVRMYKQSGIFIVFIHGGNEYYQYPSPELVKRCRFMVEMGADAVICCHTHCPLPWEIYANRPIVYGLGNLIFEANQKMSDSWYEGYMVRLIIENNQIQLEVVPYIQSKSYPGAKKMEKNAQHRFFDEMLEKNSKLDNNTFIEDEWGKFCCQQKEMYLTGLFGYNRIMRKGRKLLLKRLHSKNEVLRALHLVQCEAHQEVLNTIFKNEQKRA